MAGWNSPGPCFTLSPASAISSCGNGTIVLQMLSCQQNWIDWRIVTILQSCNCQIRIGSKNHLVTVLWAFRGFWEKKVFLVDGRHISRLRQLACQYMILQYILRYKLNTKGGKNKGKWIWLTTPHEVSYWLENYYL